MEERASYHHGDLRASLVAATRSIVADVGVRGFSVAEAARRTGVSSAAPFRHFPDREALLAAAGAAAFEDLRAGYEAAATSSADPADQLAAMSAAYVRFAVEDPAGLELISGTGFEVAAHEDAAGARRDLVAVLLPVGLALAADHADALELVRSQYALASGLAAIASRQPGAADELETLLARARRATAALVAGWQTSGP